MTVEHEIDQVRKDLAKRIEAAHKELADKIEHWRKDADAKIAKIRAEHQDAEQFRMFDSITLDAIPAGAGAVAGYVNGNWPTFAEVKRRWPKAKHLSIAVTSSADAECLDVEPGDATPADAAAWVKRQAARGVHRPVVYTSASQVATLLAALARAGVKRSDVRLWSAHYTGKPHLCGPGCGFGINTTADATQFTDHSGGKNLDESLCQPDFL